MTASVQLENVTLSVPVYEQRERSAKSFYANFVAAAFDRPQRRYCTLLHDVSLAAREGDRVAILGRNGAGKSTLLRVVAGVYAPTSGRVRLQGTRQALLNLALGFNLDATVKENIYLRGAAMGMTIGECHAIIPSVLEFSGLEGRAGDRLRVLSAGQKMRLGFSITTERQPDILVMDEWLGAGDAEFLKKAQERLHGRVDSAKIVLLASHSIPLLRRICNRAIYVDHGRVLAQGGLDEIVERFVPDAPQTNAAASAAKKEAIAKAQAERAAANARIHAERAAATKAAAEARAAARQPPARNPVPVAAAPAIVPDVEPAADATPTQPIRQPK